MNCRTRRPQQPVSRRINWAPEVKVGAEVTKGQELGYFLFGGSDYVILSQSGVTFTLKPQLFSHQLMGEELGRLTSSNETLSQDLY